MAKKKNGGSKGSHLLGPLYTAPSQSLGPHRVEGPKGGRSVGDPLSLGHGNLGKGPGADKGGGPHHEKD